MILRLGMVRTMPTADERIADAARLRAGERLSRLARELLASGEYERAHR